MPKFVTSFSRKGEWFSPSGDPIKKVYQLEFNNDLMCYKPVHVKDHNLFEEIQSYRDSTDLSIILKNLDVYEINNMYASYTFGDVADAFITDVTGVPTTYGDALNLNKKAQSMFNGLDDEIRKEYNYSAYAFAQDIGSDHFINFFSPKKDEIALDQGGIDNE